MRYLFAFIVCFWAGIIPATARSPLTVTYGIYAGGIHAVDIKGVYAITPQDYALTMDLATTGLLGRLAPWSGAIRSAGHYEDGRPVPQSHRFASTWRGETETTVFTFDDEGVLTAYQRDEAGEKVTTEMPAAEIYTGATDMLTALLSIMHGADSGGSCEGIVPAMDGKRRFDMVFRSKGRTLIDESRYSAYKGLAEICEIEIVPVAGHWRDKPRGWMSIQEQAKTNGQLPRIWFAKIRDDLPPIPVRFQITTNYGALVMHITDMK